jgi:hypothetical protein
MSSAYQVWDQRSNNIVDEYDSEDDALAVLAEWLEQDGDAEVEQLALTCDGGAGLQAIAAGPALVTYLRSRVGSGSVHPPTR